MIIESLRPLAVLASSLTLDPDNARLHDDKNLDAIKNSLSRFGQRKPVVVRRSDRVVIAGNGTLTAAIALGWTEVAAVLVDDDSVTSKAYALADNRTSELARWDDDNLSNALFEISQYDINVEDRSKYGLFDSTGFTEDDYDQLMNVPSTGSDNLSDGPVTTKDVYTVLVTLEDDVKQKALFIELRDRGFKVKV